MPLNPDKLTELCLKGGIPGLVTGTVGVLDKNGAAAVRVDRAASPRVRWLGDLSLGLFCVHPCVLFALLKLVPGRALVDLGSLGIFAVVAGLSLAIAPLLRRVLPAGLI